RVIVSLQVRPEALQQWISGAWQVNPVAAGPSKGANASVVFVDQQLWLDADGKPMATGINRIMALTVPGKHGGTGETASVVGRIYSAEPSYVPSPYKNAVSATIRRERMIKEPNLEPASGRELWTVRAAGGTAELQFDYQGGLPSRSKGEAKVGRGADLLPHLSMGAGGGRGQECSRWHRSRPELQAQRRDSRACEDLRWLRARRERHHASLVPSPGLIAVARSEPGLAGDSRGEILLPPTSRW